MADFSTVSLMVKGRMDPDGDCSNLKQEERGRDASKPREGTFHAAVFD
jgi:hypothetical protein